MSLLTPSNAYAGKTRTFPARPLPPMMPQVLLAGSKPGILPNVLSANLHVTGNPQNFNYNNNCNTGRPR
ncbi:hypothetical protein Y032_0121g978 [Ancylostoma ceylanicum]|uniref:Uncharacterized protein n=1 Tax=Ancylostoma ceylanicum TaxID=53326 RepID=A0A016TAC4_9BILA|nr:hypothetical protein Y032_0121g978 [Ancylostoma ceylanicum]